MAALDSCFNKYQVSPVWLAETVQDLVAIKTTTNTVAVRLNFLLPLPPHQTSFPVLGDLKKNCCS